MTITFDDAFGLREPATMSADEVLIRAREAVIVTWVWSEDNVRDIENIRAARHDGFTNIRAILAYERDRAKPLAEVAPHTAEDPDERAAYDLYIESGGVLPWGARKHSVVYRAILAGIKRGRELERGA